MLDLAQVKALCIYSLILGAICALFSLFPVFMPFFSLVFMPFLGALLPVGILVWRNNFYSTENKTYLILGAVSGFCIWLGFGVIFLPAVRILNFINKTYFDYGISYLNLFLIALFFIMVSTVYISTNAVVGLLFGIVYKFVRSKKNG